MKSYVFRVALAIGVIVFAFVGWRTYTTRAVCPRCNVILIVVDALRASSLPCYGYAPATAPSLCRFADETVRFEQAYANSSWTLPSVMSLYTSLYPSSHNVHMSLTDILDESIETMPQLFSRHWYATYFVASTQLNLSRTQGFGRGFSSVRYTDPTLTRDALSAWLDTIDAVGRSNQNGSPAFAYLHTNAVRDYSELLASPPEIFPLHPEYRTPDIPGIHAFTQATRQHAIRQLSEKLDDATLADETYYHYKTIHDGLVLAAGGREAETAFRHLTPPVQRRMIFRSAVEDFARTYPLEYESLVRVLYDESVRRTDAAIAQVLKRLSDNHLLNNSIVVITADHGELLGEHGLFGHATDMFEPEIRVPLVMSVPGYNCRVIDTPAQLLDIFPTVSDLTGVHTRSYMAGVSLFPYISKQASDPNRAIISEWLRHKSIITNHWHLIETQSTKGVSHSLYSRDDNKDNPEKPQTGKGAQQTINSLSRVLGDTLDNQPVYSPQSRPFYADPDDDFVRRLRSEGYLL